MSRPLILVTAAAGKTGNATALQLLQNGYPVRAFVRTDDRRAARLRDHGAEIFVGNLADMENLSAAMKGVQRAYFCAPWDGNMLHHGATFAVAAADARLELVVALGHWLSQPMHPSVATRETYLMERIVGWMPKVDSVIVNVGWFADNFMTVLEPVSQLGLFPFPLGEGRTAPVSNEDIARVVVGILTNPAPHLGRTYRPTGPKLLSPHDIADVFAKVFERRVKYQNIPDRMFFKAIKAMGMPPYLQSQLRYYIEDYRRGEFGVGAPNDTVREIGGAEPEDFETILRRYAAASPRTNRTLGNKFRAIAGFFKLLATRAPDLDGYEALRSHPVVKNAKRGLDYAAWSETHDVANAYGWEPQSPRESESVIARIAC